MPTDEQADHARHGARLAALHLARAGDRRARSARPATCSRSASRSTPRSRGGRRSTRATRSRPCARWSRTRRRPPSGPARWPRVLMGLLEKDPARRWTSQTARAVLRDLLAGPLASNAPPHVRPTRTRWSRRDRPPAADRPSGAADRPDRRPGHAGPRRVGQQRAAPDAAAAGRQPGAEPGRDADASSGPDRSGRPPTGHRPKLGEPSLEHTNPQAFTSPNHPSAPTGPRCRRRHTRPGPPSATGPSRCSGRPSGPRGGPRSPGRWARAHPVPGRRAGRRALRRRRRQPAAGGKGQPSAGPAGPLIAVQEFRDPRHHRERAQGAGPSTGQRRLHGLLRPATTRDARSASTSRAEHAAQVPRGRRERPQDPHASCATPYNRVDLTDMTLAASPAPIWNTPAARAAQQRHGTVGRDDHRRQGYEFYLTVPATRFEESKAIYRRDGRFALTSARCRPCVTRLVPVTSHCAQVEAWLADDPDPATRAELRRRSSTGCPRPAADLADRFAGPLTVRHRRPARAAAGRPQRDEPGRGPRGRGRA